MHKDIARLLGELHEVHDQMEALFDEARERFRYSLEDGRVRFTREVQEFQRGYRISSFRYVLGARITTLLTAPVIYSMLIPLLLIDLSFTIYQQICFRVYGVALVRRRDYLVNDRHKLAYLNTIEKINCAYCGYGNGVIAYSREIFSRTEQYWCPIRHAHHLHGTHARYPHFFDFGDAEAYKAGLGKMRGRLAPPTARKP